MRMNTSLINICCKCFDDFLNEMHINPGMYYIYDALYKFEVISFTPRERTQMYNEAQRLLIQMEEQKPGGGNPEFFKGSKRSAVIFKAKTMMLENYFAKLDARGKHLRDIINQNQNQNEK